METFTITRIFKAPTPLLFECWTNPNHFGNWFSPPGGRSKILYSDVRPGGYNHVEITLPDENKIYGKYTFREITPPERLVFVNSFADAEGKPIRHPFSPDWPMELLTTVMFKDLGDQTEITLTWVPIDANETEATCFASNLDSCRMGWTGTFDYLDAYLATLA